jgi:hypothetical protein
MSVRMRTLPRGVHRAVPPTSAPRPPSDDGWADLIELNDLSAPVLAT